MLTEHIGAGPLLFRYWSGLYHKGPSALAVSNGVGNWFPLRINAPAGILHLTLRASAFTLRQPDPNGPLPSG
jgi:predicted MPP superfamily phosphohydrolase